MLVVLIKFHWALKVLFEMQKEIVFWQLWSKLDPYATAKCSENIISKQFLFIFIIEMWSDEKILYLRLHFFKCSPPCRGLDFHETGIS